MYHAMKMFSLQCEQPSVSRGTPTNILCLLLQPHGRLCAAFPRPEGQSIVVIGLIVWWCYRPTFPMIITDY